MKKIVTMILTATLMFALACCDPKPAKPTQTTESVVVTESDTYPVSEIVTDTEVEDTTDTADISADISADIETETSAVTSDYSEESVTIEDTDEVDERGF